MEICGEHGEDIAYTGRDCPACDSIETMESEHQSIVDELRDRVETYSAQIDELEEKLNA